jgi:protoporphyrinogen/coproporphyrinogen III oxidase
MKSGGGATTGSRVVVVGGGVSGLAAAYRVRKRMPNAELELFEASERVGGNIRTERHEGFLLDAGPDSFLSTKPHAAALARELGLEQELIRPLSRRVYVAHAGRLEPMPAGLVLGAPTQLLPWLGSPLLSARGKLRALADLVLPARDSAEDESVESFVSRRLGREATARLAAPLLGGIYAGDITQLSLRSTFPQLAELEKQGGLIRGFRRQGRADASPFLSFRGGMSVLVERLVAAIGAERIRTGVRVERLERGSRWLIDSSRGRTEADHVLLALPAHVAAKLVPNVSLESELAAIPYASTATVFAGFDRASVAHPLDGIGFIVPRGEARILAGTWISSKWPERAPSGRVLMRAFMGGTQAPLSDSVSDAELIESALSELERLMGALGRPVFTRVYRYALASPQPIIGHAARLARMRAALTSLPGLELLGAAFDGVGIPDCVRQAEAAVERVALANQRAADRIDQ